MKTRTVLICISLLFAISCILLIASGFLTQTGVILVDHSVSEDGGVITLRTGLMSSMGYVRGYSAKQEGTGLYLTFYSTFGGLNSSIGAKSEFQLEVDSDCSAVYFNRGNSEFALVLEKDPVTNVWQEPEVS